MEKQQTEKIRRGRREYSKEEKQRHVENQIESGISLAEYCRREGLAYGNLLRWRRGEKSKEIPFRALDIIPGSWGNGVVAEVRFGSGTLLQIQGGCPEKIAMVLAKALS